ncbi:YopX family protein [Bacillus atrophaeus]|uniref:YopX family protein n=1 Tax=Bacillus atrophaeus TaxID=1452 RepID=UPI003CE9F7D4
MREIKFRAYHTEKRDGQEFPRMIDWEELLNNDEEELACYFRNEFSNVSPLMQYTGFKDKNGREIYEGDILKRTVTVVMYGSGKPPEDIVEYMKVEYLEDYAGFYIGERPLFAYVDNTRDVDTGCRCTKAEVIGNIYEDPELLEAAE